MGGSNSTENFQTMRSRYEISNIQHGGSNAAGERSTRQQQRQFDKFMTTKGYYNTEWNPSADSSSAAGDTRRLNGLVVGGRCPEGKSLAGFKLVRRKGPVRENCIWGSNSPICRSPPEWAYRYKCVDNPEMGNCQIRTTGFNQASGYDFNTQELNDSITQGDLNYLDKHNVWCREGESLKNFQVEKSNDGYSLRYKYTCCENPSAGCVTLRTPDKWSSRYSNMNSGDPHYLRQSDVQCPDGTVMSGMKLEGPSDGVASGRYRYINAVPHLRIPAAMDSGTNQRCGSLQINSMSAVAQALGAALGHAPTVGMVGDPAHSV